LIELHEKGCALKTEYDKPDDPPSKDATMIITITDPLSEPMIHKDFPGGPAELQEYVMEVCDGIKDHLVRNREDPKDTRWEYTYHQRLFKYEVPSLKPFDQIETICQKLLPRVRAPLPGHAAETHLRAAHAPLRGRPRDDGRGAPDDPSEGSGDGQGLRLHGPDDLGLAVPLAFRPQVPHARCNLTQAHLPV
jgi:hypothetical protein